MNLHITPSFNIDRLCKTASVLLFLVLSFIECIRKLTLLFLNLFQKGDFTCNQAHLKGIRCVGFKLVYFAT